MRNMICEPIWFCIRYNECIQNDPCRENEILAYIVANMINGKAELVPQCPLMRNMIFKPRLFVFR